MTTDRELIEHREPTVATVKALYSTAFRCGYPTCQKPLYRMSDATGDLLLNSTVAHINARREKGPRWDKDMTEADNRSAANLIVLCLEHSKEIDDIPAKYPADELRQWKVDQFAEYERLQRNWRLTDGQAREVAEQSFTPHELGRATAGAGAVVHTARLATMLAESATRSRRPANAILAEYRARVDWYTRQSGIFDDQGERLSVRPPRIEIAQFEDGLRAALTESVAAVEPVALELTAELNAAKAASPQLGPWCDWTARCVAAVVAESGVSQGDDDAALDEALNELSLSSDSVVAAWRGEAPNPPPAAPEPAAPEPESPAESAERVHRETLERARPWSRVQTRAYSAEVYDSLIAQMEYASGLPPVVTQLPYDLKRTAASAAAVARNATEEEFAGRVDDAQTLVPLSAAVLLLIELGHIARESNRDDLAADARRRADDLLGAEDWLRPSTWEANVFHGLALLESVGVVIGSDDLTRRLEVAIPAVGPDVVLPALASWREQYQDIDFSGPGTPQRYIGGLPQWLPRTVLVAEVRRVWPALVTDLAEDLDGSAVEHLAAQFLARTEGAASA